MKNPVKKLEPLKPKLLGRDFPSMDDLGNRKAVCTRCHVPMQDIEPASAHGEFWHPTKNKEGKPHPCKNEGKRFSTLSPEIEPFLRKAARRRNHRNGVRP